MCWTFEDFTLPEGIGPLDGPTQSNLTDGPGFPGVTRSFVVTMSLGNTNSLDGPVPAREAYLPEGPASDSATTSRGDLERTT